MNDPLLLVEDNAVVYVRNAAQHIVLLKIQYSVQIVKMNIDSIASLPLQYSLSRGVVQLGPLIRNSSRLELTISDDNNMRTIRFFFRCPICNGFNGTNSLPISSFKYQSKCFVADCLLCSTAIRVAMNDHWCTECKDRIECMLEPMSSIQILGEQDGDQEIRRAV